MASSPESHAQSHGKEIGFTICRRNQEMTMICDSPIPHPLHFLLFLLIYFLTWSPSVFWPVHKIIIKNFSNLCYVPNAIQNLRIYYFRKSVDKYCDTTEIAFRKLNYKVDLRRSEQGNAKLFQKNVPWSKRFVETQPSMWVFLREKWSHHKGPQEAEGVIDFTSAYGSPVLGEGLWIFWFQCPDASNRHFI